jgi:hypothetical protein
MGMRCLLSLLHPLLFFSDPTSSGHGDDEVRCLPPSELGFLHRAIAPMRVEDPSEGKSTVWRGGGYRTVVLGRWPAPSVRPVTQATMDPPSIAAGADTFPTPGPVESLSRCPSLERGRIPVTWVAGFLPFYQWKSQRPRDPLGLRVDELGWVPLALNRGRLPGRCPPTWQAPEHR